MELSFAGEVVEWRGPSPYHFVPVPEAESAEIDAVRTQLTYGWGVVPVQVRLGATTWSTSLFPKDGGYLVPVKDAVRRAEGVAVGDGVALTLVLDLSGGRA